MKNKNKLEWYMMLIIFIMMNYLNFFNFSLLEESILYKFFMLNFISKIFIFMFLWIFFISIIFFYKKKMMNSIFLSMILMISMFIYVDNLYFFMSLFELSVVPLFFLMLIYGMNPERMNSLLYLYMYMYSSFIPSLIMVISFLNLFKEKELSLMMMSFFYLKMSDLFVLILIFTFLVKVPCFLFHSWLPKAHTESPVTGSMVLAGIYLKLGSYGLLKFELFLLSSMLNKVFSFFFLLGGMLVSIWNFTQSDSKRIIALSSVVHLSLFISIFFIKILNDFIFLILILGHSLISFMIFCLNYQIYKKNFSRINMMLNSMVLKNPMLVMLTITFLIFNFSFPGTVSFWSELFCFSLLIKSSMIFTLAILMMILFILLYSINLMVYKIFMPKISEINKDLDKFSTSNLVSSAHISYPIFMIMMILF